MNVKLLHNSKIDLDKWDELIIHAPNSRIYAESWYLDIIEPDWMGLVYGDYDYVMPIIIGKKWGIEYLYQPAYVQQHGIFPTATPDVTTEFIHFITSKYKYINLSLNSMNVDVSKIVPVENRNNFILSLQNNYAEVQGKYSAHAKRYVKKAQQECEVSSHVNIEEYLQLKLDNSPSSFQKVHYRPLKLILLNAIKRNKGIIYGAYSPRNELIAAAFFLVETKRITYLNSVSTDEGKTSRAMYAIIDFFIQEYAGSGFHLDFEGSTIEGIARFFKGFGASPETYQHVRFNRLPALLKLIKK